MRFDHFTEADFASTVIPDGHNEVRIQKVKTVTLRDTGDPVCVIEFRDMTDSYEPVQKWLNPKKKRDTRAAMDLNFALGRPWDADIDDSIEGRIVTIVSQRAVKDGEAVLDRDGNQRVYINAFLQSASDHGQQAPVGKAPVNRTPTQRADAATGAPDDDIPF